MSSNVTWLIHGCTYQTKTDQTGESLLDLTRRNGFPVPGAIPAVCGAAGRCGKCRVRIVEGYCGITAADRKYLSGEELDLGYRLACQARVTGDLTVRIVTEETGQMQVRGWSEESEAQCPSSCVIAVDLGSTTLAAVLAARDGTVLKQRTAVNSQSMYGADVISRIQASVNGCAADLRTCIRSDLRRLWEGLCDSVRDDAPDGSFRITKAAVTANTAMLHMLRGYSCGKLGQAPFEPVNLDVECLDFEEVFGGSKPPVQNLSKTADRLEQSDDGECPVYLLPGMSAFVGADITAGLYSSGFWQTPEQEVSLFLDLGTNGEMAAGNREFLVAGAGAAGPAFEGGGLSCGMPGVSGAISRVTYLCHRLRIQTIGQKKPLGICGTGALEAVAAMRREGLLDKSGLLAPELFESGLVLAQREDGSDIRLTQGDIRNIQMAKAAIRAGIDTLLLRYQESIRPQQLKVGRVYLAGGFGYYLSPDTAICMGLFPPEWKDNIIICGNTSLKGALAFLTEEDCAGTLEQIRKKNKEVCLAQDDYFQEAYIRQMEFP